MKIFNLHLISDSTGETVNSVSRAVLAQFGDVEPTQHIWSLVRTNGQMEKIIDGIEENPGVVMYTLVDVNLRKTLRKECEKRNLPCIPILGPAIRGISAYINKEAKSKPGMQHELDDSYFDMVDDRVDALNYTLSHDDGQNAEGLNEADIVIVGVSRTSKSPTCIYLAYRGFKTANIPFVKECPLPDNITNLTNPLVVGLTIGHDRLIQIRRSRLQSLNEDDNTNYTCEEEVRDEIKQARKLFSENGWPIIDVTRRSVEETAALIIQYRQRMVASDL